jgi:hypothetical protein
VSTKAGEGSLNKDAVSTHGGTSNSSNQVSTFLHVFDHLYLKLTASASSGPRLPTRVQILVWVNGRVPSRFTILFSPIFRISRKQKPERFSPKPEQFEFSNLKHRFSPSQVITLSFVSKKC